MTTDNTLFELHSELTKMLMSGNIDGEALEAVEDAEDKIDALRSQIALTHDGALRPDDIRAAFQRKFPPERIDKIIENLPADAQERIRALFTPLPVKRITKIIRRK